MKNILIYVSIIIYFLTFFSCEYDKFVEPEIENYKVKIEQENPLINEFAQVVASSVNKVEGRAFIKSKVNEKFDGDYNLLFAQARNQKIQKISKKSITKTYEEYLAKNFYKQGNKKKSSNNDFKTFLDELLEKNPLLQISVPEVFDNSTDEWDIEEHQPLVAFLPRDYDDQKTKMIPAYDAAGNFYTIDAINPPNEPVIVIGLNESVIAVKKENVENNNKYVETCLEPLYETEDYYYYLRTNCEEFDDGDFSEGSGNTYCDREDNSQSDYLNKAKIVDKSAWRRIEGWPAGRPEFTVYIVRSEKINGGFEKKVTTKVLSKDGWVKRYLFSSKIVTKELDIPVLRWDKAKYGNTISYGWFEVDQSGGFENLKFNFSSKYVNDEGYEIKNDIELEIRDQGEQAGSSEVYYCDNTDNEGYKYSTGIVEFWINQQ